MAVTLRDIAKHVNLSHATVSFVLNDRRDVTIPETTRERVLVAAKELGYYPNRAARALVMGKTRVVGMWIPPLRSLTLQRLFQDVTDRFRLAGFDSLYSRFTAGSNANPFEWPVDGIVCVEGDEPVSESILPQGVPLVVVGPHTGVEHDRVHIDLTAGTVEATMHLLETGRTKIACITSESSDAPGTIAGAYSKIVESAGNRALCHYVSSGTKRTKWSEVLSFLQANDPIDAVICGSDELTSITNRAIRDLHGGIAADVALIGFGFSEDFEFYSPGIMSIEIPVDTVARIACDLLLTRMADPKLPIRAETVESRLRTTHSLTVLDVHSIEGRTSLL